MEPAAERLRCFEAVMVVLWWLQRLCVVLPRTLLCS